jgi:hypothetical protein
LQSVAPQVEPVVHDAVQQWPVPVAPQTPLTHWLLPPQTVPAVSLATQVPDAPGFWQKPVVQSLSPAQEVLQAVPLAQIRLPGQAAAVPGVQVPEPLQVPAGVSVEPVHDAEPQLVVLVG